MAGEFAVVASDRSPSTICWARSTQVWYFDVAYKEVGRALIWMRRPGAGAALDGTKFEAAARSQDRGASVGWTKKPGMSTIDATFLRHLVDAVYEDDASVVGA